MVDLKKILDEFDLDDGDFGFSAISEEEYNKEIVESEQTIQDYKDKLASLEKLILPFLTKLLKTADNAYIHWPNRAPQIKEQIEKIVKITRS